MIYTINQEGLHQNKSHKALNQQRSIPVLFPTITKMGYCLILCVIDQVYGIHTTANFSFSL